MQPYTPVQHMDEKIGELTTAIDILLYMAESADDGELRRVVNNSAGLYWLMRDMLEALQEDLVTVMKKGHAA